MKYLIALSVSLTLVALALCQDFGSMAVTIKQATDKVKEKMADENFAGELKNNFNDLPPSQAEIAKAIYIPAQEAADKAIIELVAWKGGSGGSIQHWNQHPQGVPLPPQSAPTEDMVVIGGFRYPRYQVTTASIEYNEYRAKEEARCAAHQAPDDYLYGEFWDKMIKPEAREGLANYLSGIYENTRHYNPPC